MKILIYGINYSPELTGIGKYSGEMARWLAEQGHEVRVVTAPPYYPDWKVWDGFSAWLFGTRVEAGVTVHRCPLYVPAKPSALKRMLHLGSFSLSSTFALLPQLFWKPDVVMLVVPTLFCSPQALLLSKLTGAQSVLHIQDYEVDALFGLGIAKGGLLKRLGFAAERAILRGFDRVSTISSGMLLRAVHKGANADNLLFLPNWAEIERFQCVPRSAVLLERLGIDPAKRVALYSGNIGEKQGLETVLEAAQRLAAHSDLTFLVVGEGAGKARLVEQAQRLGLTNLVFAPLQSYEDLPSLLASADCHLVIQKRGAADAVLPSKLTNILAVGGNAVITADPYTTLGLLCDEYPGIAARVEPESVDALVQGIEACLAMPSPNRVASFYAEENLDKDRILARFVAELEQQPLAVPVGTAFPEHALAVPGGADFANDASLGRTEQGGRLAVLLQAIAEQANVLALDLAMNAASDNEEKTKLAADVGELTRLIEQTGSGPTAEIDSNETAAVVGQIRQLIGRVLAQLEQAAPARPQRSADDMSNVIQFPQPAAESTSLSTLARELDAMVSGERT